MRTAQVDVCLLLRHLCLLTRALGRFLLLENLGLLHGGSIMPVSLPAASMTPISSSFRLFLAIMRALSASNSFNGCESRCCLSPVRVAAGAILMHLVQPYRAGALLQRLKR